jgi:hypothetical protein
MTDQPDLSTLAGRARYASEVIEEINAHPASKGCGVPHRGRADLWNGALLRSFASQSAAIERADAEVEALATDIGLVVYHFGDSDPRMRAMFRRQARALIAAGWRKGGPAS